MKKITILSCIFIAAFTYLASAQNDADMKAWQNYMTPGEVHKMIGLADGEWNEEITMWMEPGKPPIKSVAISKNEMILGGRYQMSKTTGMMMGAPFEGMSLVGYDNAKKLFTTTWIDNFGTGTMTLEGTWNEQAKAITFTGKAVDPMTGKDIDVKEIMKFIDKDTQQMEMYDTKNGTQTKTIEIKFTRKK